MQIRTLTFGDFTADFLLSLQHYLRKSRDEMLLEELESVMATAASHQRPDLLALAAFDDNGRMLGWCLLAVRPATAQIGSEVVLWGVYVFPGRARLRDLVKEAMRYIEAYARGAGSSRLVMHTRRGSEAYIRMLESMGWSVHSVCLTKPVEHTRA